MCLQELTLSRYFAVTPEGPRPGVQPEPMLGVRRPASPRSLAQETGVHVHASLWEERPGAALGLQHRRGHGPGRPAGGPDPEAAHPDHRGLLRGPLLRRRARRRDAFRTLDIDGADFGFPTCWDQWFPELARAYSLAGAAVLVYPTAIGSEPDHPDFDTEPLWETVIIANGIANGTFMVAVNRIGDEGEVTFYGSSFISDPYGRKLVQAPATNPRCWSPSSTSTSARTGWRCSLSWPPAGPTPTRRSSERSRPNRREGHQRNRERLGQKKWPERVGAPAGPG